MKRPKGSHFQGDRLVQFKRRDANSMLQHMADQPFVNYVPTMTGGVGKKALHRFYEDYFMPGNPSSLNVKLLSRTIGVDRVVDELLVTFDHTEEMPWILPSIPPTDKHVEVALVSIVCLRGGMLHHEHVYWDQASVLLQVGLLEKTNIPVKMRSLDIKVLPVTGAESARKVLDKKSTQSNLLLDDWDD